MAVRKKGHPVAVTAIVSIPLAILIGAIFSSYILLSEGIFAITALLIVWYALETHLMKNELVTQNQTFQKQSFENTFFSLLHAHNDLVRSIEIRGIGADACALTIGKACFVKFYNEFIESFQRSYRDYDKIIDPLNRMGVAYGDFFGKKQSDLDHYFRNLYHIITYVKNNDIDDKRLYTNTLRAQLSSHELLLVFYHCLTTYGEPLKPLVEDFALLKNLPRRQLIDDADTNYYKPSAFDEK